MAYCDNFVQYGQKSLPLDMHKSKLLHYFDCKDHTYCCIATSGDVTELEANNFLK